MQKLNVLSFRAVNGAELLNVDFTKETLAQILLTDVLNKDFTSEIDTVVYPSKLPKDIKTAILEPIVNNIAMSVGAEFIMRESHEYEYVKSTGSRADYEDPKYWMQRNTGVEYDVATLKPYMERYMKLKNATDAFMRDAKENGIIHDIVQHVFYIRTFESCKNEADKKKLAKENDVEPVIDIEPETDVESENTDND